MNIVTNIRTNDSPIYDALCHNGVDPVCLGIPSMRPVSTIGLLYQTVKQSQTAYELTKDFIHTAKEFYKKVEPYQPTLSSVILVGKGFWKTYTSKNSKKNIQKEKRTLNRLQEVQKNKRFRKKLSRDIQDQSNQIKKTQLKIDDRFFALAQLPSLLWWHPPFSSSDPKSHPKANVWNSGVNVCNRINTLYQHFSHPIDFEAGTSIGLNIAGGLGDLANLLKHSGLISGEDPVTRFVLAASFTSMLVDVGIQIAKNRQKITGGVKAVGKGAWSSIKKHPIPTMTAITALVTGIGSLCWKK